QRNTLAPQMKLIRVIHRDGTVAEHIFDRHLQLDVNPGDEVQVLDGNGNIIHCQLNPMDSDLEMVAADG
ncbi:MAG: hypothetical protein AAF226_11445, partial [Verrucomicrobiota bacterium]